MYIFILHDRVTCPLVFTVPGVSWIFPVMDSRYSHSSTDGENNKIGWVKSDHIADSSKQKPAQYYQDNN